jgi:hypothetical protein
VLASLSEHLATLCLEKDVRERRLNRKAGIDRSSFQIFPGVKNHPENKAPVGVRFRLDYEQTQQLLESA